MAGIMAIGTLGSFAVIVLANQNQQTDSERYKALAAEYQSQYDAYTKQEAAYQEKQNEELSAKYYGTFQPFQSRATSFDAASVTELKTEDLLAGDGEAINDTTPFSVYYILWLPDGTIKEQSIADGKLSSPLSVETGLKNASLIEGWKEGLIGMKLGGVRELTIPSDKAYKETGTKDAQGNVSIAPNTPLKFVVMAIPVPDRSDAPKQPTIPEELLQLYQRGVRG